MANDLKHGSVGTELTQAEWEAVGAHVVANQAVGDIIYADTTSQLLRLGIGSTNDVLRVTGGKPDWQATSFITALGTIATGVWQGTDVGVAYGGTGVSTLTQNGVLVGNGSSAIGSIDMSTKGHVLIGDGSGNPQMLGVGTNNHVMTADSGETTGVKWAAPAAAAAGSLTGSTLASGVVTTSATTVGVLNSGSINTGFGTINNGSSTITTSGVITGGALVQDKVIRKAIPEKTVADNSATSVFRIETTNESGDDDGGSYVCKVYALISHPGASDSPHSASKGFEAVFCRAVRNDGTGANSTVTEIAETASAATTSSERDITTVTLSVVETSEYQIDVQFLVDLTGSSAQSSARVTCMVELIYYQFTTAPTITAL